MPDVIRHQFQRVALAVLLCTNSKLGQKWRENPKNVTMQDLTGLGFSPEFAHTRLATIASVPSDKVFRFQAIATDLQNIMWDGEPPHPPDDVVTELVVAARLKDRDRDGG